MNGQLVFAKSYEEAKENAVELIGKNSTFEELEKEGYVLESNGDNYIKDALNKCIEYLIKEKEPLIYVSRNAKHQKCKMKIILHSGSVGEIIEYLRGGIDDEKMKTENIPVDYTSYLPTIIEKKLYLSKNKTMVAELTEGREARTTAEASKLKAIVDYFNNHKYVVLMKDFDKEEKGTIPPNIYVVCYDTIDPQPAKPTNILLYGAPGTGKSYTAKQIVEGDAKNTYEHLNLRDLPKGDFVRVTFHPDTDYASFVGCYKPSMNGKEIEYKFVPQAFLKIYVDAWKNLISNEKKQYYLVIEELNRGNCAQIFGDIFQLLDRNDEGYSDYYIGADTDVVNYLKSAEGFGEDDYKKYTGKLKDEYKEGAKDIEKGVLALPCNLTILATMNTSDQSLFPIDSAFKRRWEWKYVKINYDAKDLEEIELWNGTKWLDFIKEINKYIAKETHSADKQIGERFIKLPKGIKTIDYDTFRDKVMFYLFNDVFKDDVKFGREVFGDSGDKALFEDLFNENDYGQEIVKKFIEKLCPKEKGNEEIESF